MSNWNKTIQAIIGSDADPQHQASARASRIAAAERAVVEAAKETYRAWEAYTAKDGDGPLHEIYVAAIRAQHAAVRALREAEHAE